VDSGRAQWKNSGKKQGRPGHQNEPGAAL